MSRNSPQGSLSPDKMWNAAFFFYPRTALRCLKVWQLCLSTKLLFCAVLGVIYWHNLLAFAEGSSHMDRRIQFRWVHNYYLQFSTVKDEQERLNHFSVFEMLLQPKTSEKLNNESFLIISFIFNWIPFLFPMNTVGIPRNRINNSITFLSIS